MGQNAPLWTTPEAGRGWAQLTLERLLAEMPGGLRLVTGGVGSATRLLRWTATSELEDPTPFLLGEEFLLTAGVPLLDRPPDEIDAYVGRLRTAGVTALGFGISPVHEELPEHLVRACTAQGLPLVRVAESTPFVAVTRKFATMLEAENDQMARHMVRTTRRMLRAVLSGASESSLLEVLAAEVRAWVVLTGADGRVSASAGRPVLDAEQLRPLQEKIFAGSGPRVEVASFAARHAAHVVGHPLRSERDVSLGTLVLGSATGFSPPQQTVIALAVGLLEVLLRQRAVGGNFGPSRLATRLLLAPSALLGVSPDRDRTLARPLAQSIPGPEDAPVRIVQGVRREDRDPWPPEAVGELAELIQLRRLFDTSLVELTDYGFVTITRSAVSDRLVTDLESLGWLVAVGGPVQPAELPGDNERVTVLRRRLRSGGRSARIEHVRWTVTGLLGEGQGRQVAERLLAPLDSVPEERRRVLLRTLRSWLAVHGSWDACGRDLGLHRNSVRRQINQLATALGLDLDDARNRAELLIALQFLPEKP